MDKNSSFKRKISSRAIRSARLLPVKGFKLGPGTTAEELLAAYSSIGFQASHLGKAADVVARMQEDKTTIFLAFT